MIAVKHVEMLGLGDNQYKKEGSSHDEPKTRTEVAKVAGVSEPTVKRAKKAIALEPDKVDEIIEGKVTPTKVIHEERGEGCPVDWMVLY